MPKEDPFKNVLPEMLTSLESLDKAADKQMEESKYTVDGILLEKGLEVWCVDTHIFSEDIGGAWKILRDYRCRDGWALRRSGIRHTAFYNRLFASKKKAIIFRIGVLKMEMQRILREKVTPLEKEIERLVEMYMNEFPGPIEEL